VVIAGGEKDNFSIRVFNNAGVASAIFGEAQSGAGAFTAFDAEGKPVVSMNGGFRNVAVYNDKGADVAKLEATAEGKGLVRVTGDNDSVVASLAHGANGGELLIADSAGTPMVSGFAHSGGYGVVLTGPAGTPRGLLLALPGSFIKGKP
jgi:hypothetical protein